MINRLEAVIDAKAYVKLKEFLSEPPEVCGPMKVRYLQCGYYTVLDFKRREVIMFLYSITFSHCFYYIVFKRVIGELCYADMELRIHALTLRSKPLYLGRIVTRPRRDSKLSMSGACSRFWRASR